MDRYHIIRHPLGGSDIFDENGNQVGYSLPSILGGGEDFYDMNGTPVGQSFDDEYGMSDFIGTDSTYGVLDQEIMMGRNAWLDGDPFREENPGTDFPDSMDAGDGFE